MRLCYGGTDLALYEHAFVQLVCDMLSLFENQEIISCAENLICL